MGRSNGRELAWVYVLRVQRHLPSNSIKNALEEPNFRCEGQLSIACRMETSFKGREPRETAPIV